MKRIQARLTATCTALATIALVASPTPALGAEPPVHARVYARAAGAQSANPSGSNGGGPNRSLRTGASGSDDGGGSDDGVTTRSSAMKPVGGQGPLLGGSPTGSGTGSGSAARHHRHHRHNSGGDS